MTDEIDELCAQMAGLSLHAPPMPPPAPPASPQHDSDDEVLAHLDIPSTLPSVFSSAAASRTSSPDLFAQPVNSLGLKRKPSRQDSTQKKPNTHTDSDFKIPNPPNSLKRPRSPETKPPGTLFTNASAKNASSENSPKR